MKRKRLSRDKKWYFQGFPYYQMRIDNDDFHGLVSIIRLADGEYLYWDLPKAGKTPVCGKGMLWLQLIPDGSFHVTTAMFLPEDRTAEGVSYDKSVSLWYVDIIDCHGTDPDGVAYFIDEYLDVIFDVEGDICIDDRDELDEAYRSGELTEAQYQRALEEADKVIAELCSDPAETQRRCERILRSAEDMIAKRSGVMIRNEIK